jgi:hypothetical protein
MKEDITICKKCQADFPNMLRWLFVAWLRWEPYATTQQITNATSLKAQTPVSIVIKTGGVSEVD